MYYCGIYFSLVKVDMINKISTDKKFIGDKFDESKLICRNENINMNFKS